MRKALRLVDPSSADPIARELEIDLQDVNTRLSGASAHAIIEWGLETFGTSMIMSSSFGAQSALMLHLVTRVAPGISIVFLDTGYLFPETYQFADELTRRLDLNLRVYSPALTAARLEALHGRLWEGDENDLARYGALTKVEPMDRALRELQAKAWVAGLSRSQTSFRAGLRTVEKQDGIYKIHPILEWSKDEIHAYMEKHELPYHPLYAFGYRSIGDAHSTVPTRLDQDERDGRKLGAHRECGIHLPRTPEAQASLKSSGL
jgi:phosphoadenosine phosphosulfate reductase